MSKTKLDSLEARGILDPGGLELNPLNLKPFTDRYRELAKIWSEFPAYEKADQIISSIENNPITLVVSGTGSGKTVLIPKFALHWTRYAGRVAVTLPKRSITETSARFAAETLDITLGNEVGYVYKGSPKSMLNDSNRIVYMTDGLLISKFVRDPTLSEFDVIIIDEAHERKVQIDFLLLFIKKALEVRTDLRVIIMSATIDADLYVNYLAPHIVNVIHISGKPNYPITVKWLDNETSESYEKIGLKVIASLWSEGIIQDLLFFITSSNEALDICRKIRKRFERLYCVELHSDTDLVTKLYATDLNKFMELGNYTNKIVLSTNVAESSLTIAGLKFVLDSGFELHSSFDPEIGARTLDRKLITQAQALQRRGRVGRTEPGTCYHFMTKAQFKNLKPYPEPDILRSDVTIDILNLCFMSDDRTLTEGVELANELITPPSSLQIAYAFRIYQTYPLFENDVVSWVSYAVTSFALPIQQSLFLVYGYQLGVAVDVARIIAMIGLCDGQYSCLFERSVNPEIQAASKAFLKKIAVKRGDHFTLLKILNTFVESKSREELCRLNGLRMKRLLGALDESRKLFGKIRDLSQRFTEMRSRGPPPKSATEKNRAILSALKSSHLHLVGRNLKPEFTKSDVRASISSYSVVNNFYNKKSLSKKKFIYEELFGSNSQWKFNVITII